MASNQNKITPEQILKHREMRKKCGLVGCIDGSDGPLNSLSGISWRPADPKNPSCFCHDCRTVWDKEGTIDAELVNTGHKMACYTYENLLRNTRKAPETPTASPPPARTMTEHPEAYKMSVPREVFFPPLLKRTDGGSGGCEDECDCGMWRHPPSVVPSLPPPPPSPPFAGLKIKIPPRTEGMPSISLPAPRHRDVMNESRETRLKKDLLEMLTQFRSEMIDIMDGRRRAMLYEDPEARDIYLASVAKNEANQWEKIHAAELLIHTLDV